MQAIAIQQQYLRQVLGTMISSDVEVRPLTNRLQHDEDALNDFSMNRDFLNQSNYYAIFQSGTPEKHFVFSTIDFHQTAQIFMTND